MTILQLQIDQDNITDELLKAIQPYARYFTLKRFTPKTDKPVTHSSDFVDFFRNSPLVESDIELSRDTQSYQHRIEF